VRRGTGASASLRLAVLILAAVTSTALAAVPARAATWTTTRITTNYFAYWPSLALDGIGKAHIAFARPFSGIYYATNRSGSWTKTQVTASGDDSSPSAVIGPYDSSPSLALDGNGKAHIAFQREGTNPGIYYATNRSGSWTKTQMTNDYDGSPSLALDGTGKAHIAFWRSGSGIYYATNASGSWTKAQVTANAVDDSPSLALDGAGKAHIAFDRGDTGLYIATN